MFPFSSFLTYIVVTSITPGPNNIVALSNGTRLGWRGGLPYLAGQQMTQWVLINGCIFAFRSLNSLLPRLAPVMRVVGAAYILYLAWKTFRSGSDVESSESHATFRSGVALQFVNPKLYLYIFATAQAYILPYFSDQPAAMLGLGTVMTLCCGACSLCWLLGGSLFRRVLSRWGRIVNAVMALLLAYCAVSLFL